MQYVYFPLNVHLCCRFIVIDIYRTTPGLCLHALDFFCILLAFAFTLKPQHKLGFCFILVLSSILSVYNFHVISYTCYLLLVLLLGNITSILLAYLCPMYAVDELQLVKMVKLNVHLTYVSGSKQY